MAERRTLEIARLGAQGDGVAETEAGPVYVPFALQGERVSADVEGDSGRLVEVLAPSPQRAVPPCRHFGACGGCALQHMERQAYETWKSAQVLAAFAQRGIAAPMRPLIACAGQRRRASLAARRAGGGTIDLGFHAAGSHDIVALSECPVLHGKIMAAFPALKSLAGLVTSPKGEVRVVMAWTDAGLDVVLDDVNAQLTPSLRAAIAAAATAAGLARVSVNRDPVYEGLTPFFKFGRAEVAIAPGVFAQAVKESEDQMVRLAIEAVGKAKTAADLFSGLGAFTFRLAEKARVFAADSDRPAIAALTAAAKKATGLKPIEARLRDLFREPLSATELRDFEAIVFDPPRAGAEAQARMIARAKVKTVVAVSCNPATLARDARILIDGGYVLESVTPVDQFLYTPHIEAVAVFRK